MTKKSGMIVDPIKTIKPTIIYELFNISSNIMINILVNKFSFTFRSTQRLFSSKKSKNPYKIEWGKIRTAMSN